MTTCSAVLLSSTPGDTMGAFDRPALAAGAAPGVADPVQPVAAQLGVGYAQANGSNRDGVKHRRKHRRDLSGRQCIACGVVEAVDTTAPCPCCGASSFHLIPLAPAHDSAA